MSFYLQVSTLQIAKKLKDKAVNDEDDESRSPDTVKPRAYEPAISEVRTAEGFEGEGRIYTTPWVQDGKLYNQDYEKLKAASKESGKLFEDPEFPCNITSLYYSTAPEGTEDIIWKRPSEISKEPKFFEDGASRFDVNQGEIGNCWVVSAIANLTMDEPLFCRVVPKEQGSKEEDFSSDNYAGIFHFKFWQYGEWVDVVVDDYLPTREGYVTPFIFLSPGSENEFWSPLLEKAYAKLYGNYEQIRSGKIAESLRDFTGGSCEHYDMKDKSCPENLFALMKEVSGQRSMMGCSTQVGGPGLIRAHAYSITKLLEVDFMIDRVQMVRLRNPWGKTEWTGKWSDSSPEWNYVSDEQKAEAGLVNEDDGEFWMSFKDFREYFDTLEICNVMTNLANPSKEDEKGKDDKRVWHMKSVHGSWVAGETAGGCGNPGNPFKINPKYVFEVVTPDDDDSSDSSSSSSSDSDDEDEAKCTVLVSLIQKDVRKKKHMGFDGWNIGFKIFAGEEFSWRNMVGGSPTYANTCEVTGRLIIPPGKYCIIPSTFYPDEEGDFFLRIFTCNPINTYF